jgi:hypothetical protein
MEDRVWSPGSARALACRRRRLAFANFLRGKAFRRGRRKQHARRVRSPIRHCLALSHRSPASAGRRRILLRTSSFDIASRRPALTLSGQGHLAPLPAGSIRHLPSSSLIPHPSSFRLHPFSTPPEPIGASASCSPGTARPVPAPTPAPPHSSGARTPRKSAREPRGSPPSFAG